MVGRWPLGRPLAAPQCEPGPWAAQELSLSVRFRGATRTEGSYSAPPCLDEWGPFLTPVNR